MIYLDYSANTPADPAVLDAFLDAELRWLGNPNANHPAGEAAREAMAEATEAIAEMLNILPSEIIYTSGASEANNLAIKGLAAAQRGFGKHIISTPLEHASVSAPLDYLKEQGFEVELIEPEHDGKISPEKLRELLRDDTILVAVSAVDSELGVVQPISEIARLLSAYPNCRLHVDATQAVGKIPFSFEGVDTASLAAHKFYGLNGSGILFKKNSVAIEALIHGGNGASPYRSGTPTLALVKALEKALSLSLPELDKRYEYVKGLNEFLRSELTKFPGVRINSPAGAIPHILNLSVDGIKGTRFQSMLAAKGVCVSVKSACSSDGEPSRAVYAVSGDRKNALSSWRVSLSHLTSEKELKDFLGIFERCISADEKSIQSPETGFRDREEVGQPASVEIPTLGTQPSAKIACENELKVYINERPAMQIVCTPEYIDELIVGRLLTEKLIDGIGDISSLKLYNKGRQARIELSEKRALELKDREADFVPTCCTDNKLYFERRRDRAPVKPIPWELAWFEKLLEKLREGEPLFSNTRSAHACYLGKNGEALCCREDIGRHNALDKAIGYGLLNGVELSQCYLFTTGRMPLDMVKKAVNAGVPILASKAYPTDRAVEIARRDKLTLITVRENGTVLVWSTPKK